MESHEIKGAVKELEGKAEKVYGKAREKVTDATARFSAGAEDQYDEQESEIMGLVRAFPGAAVGLALLVGFLAGSLVTSRR